LPIAQRTQTGQPLILKRAISWLQSFRPCPGQRGIMVTKGEEVVGLEILPNERTYAAQHRKRLPTYAAMLLANARSFDDGEFQDKAMAFYRAIATSRETQGESVGHVSNLQLDAKGVSGEVLLLRDQVCYLSAFGYCSEEGDRIQL